ncbi:MAG: hypothetical protein PHF12_07700, partial [Candidatus Omnitrophica bacterium]|nr:hypothetical protein [Candidatus Omnitrophota bacterium]
MKKRLIILILAVMINLAGVRAAMAVTEFVSTIKASGGDYSSLATWEAANQCDLTAGTTRVFSH